MKFPFPAHAFLITDIVEQTRHSLFTALITKARCVILLSPFIITDSHELQLEQLGEQLQWGLSSFLLPLLSIRLLMRSKLLLNNLTMGKAHVAGGQESLAPFTVSIHRGALPVTHSAVYFSAHKESYL